MYSFMMLYTAALAVVNDACAKSRTDAMSCIGENINLRWKLRNIVHVIVEYGKSCRTSLVVELRRYSGYTLNITLFEHVR